MNFGQLDRYIGDLRQSGFDTMRLRVDLWHKLAYPLMAVVMAVLAIPFALSMGRRGSLTGIAVAIAVALAYLVVDGPLRRHGQCELSSRCHGRLVLGSSLWAGRRLSAAENAYIGSTWDRVLRRAEVATGDSGMSQTRHIACSRLAC